MKKKIFIEDSVENLRLTMSLVGYKNAGESIILFLKDSTEKVLFSCVIDSYKRRSQNKTLEILQENNLEYVDIIGFTHPHLDHTKGLNDIIQAYFTDASRIVLPDYIIENKENVELTTEENTIIEELLERVKNKEKNILPISCNDQTESLILEVNIIEKSTGINKTLRLACLAPNKIILMAEILKRNKKINPNLFSLVFFLDFDGFKIFMGGDVINENIECIEKELINFANIIKVPHHCSDTSDRLLDKLKMENRDDRVICSTVSRSHNLPKYSIMNRYLDLSKTFHLTNNLNKSLDNENFGIINYEYFDRKLLYSIQGNAELISQIYSS
ncbi:MAG: hypothetical protein ACRCW7_11795 [Cetobacterium sp.]